jgi:hypothetical protein
MRKSNRSPFFSSSIASDEESFPFGCRAIDSATDNISDKQLPNQENSGKGFRIGIIETCDADRCRDYFHSRFEQSIANFSASLSLVPEGKEPDLRNQDSKDETRTSN